MKSQRKDNSRRIVLLREETTILEKTETGKTVLKLQDRSLQAKTNIPVTKLP